MGFFQSNGYLQNAQWINESISKSALIPVEESYQYGNGNSNASDPKSVVKYAKKLVTNLENITHGNAAFITRNPVILSIFWILSLMPS